MFPKSYGRYNKGHVIKYMFLKEGFSREKTLKLINALKHKKSLPKRLPMISAIELIKKHKGGCCIASSLVKPDEI